ncbi:hypothetical protein B0H10DRAFT_2226407 [Mycena sp. CBHHK59/15]|nr:hypothetical protein B0H10DRAFT_2226407 [Mycena sp. CBHHK59/15]
MSVMYAPDVVRSKRTTMAKRAKAAAHTGLDFLDISAVDAGDDEDEESEEEDGFIDRRADIDNDFVGEYSRPHWCLMDDSSTVDPDELARFVEERYSGVRRVRATGVGSVDRGPLAGLSVWATDDDIIQLSYTSTSADALIWRIRVARGHECDVVCTILKLCEANSQQACVLSASTIPSVRGSVYIESSSEADVLRLFRTVAFIRRRFAPEQIPIDDYMSLMQVTDRAQLDIGSWVRYTRRGVYCGDLAWVKDFDPHRWEYTVWLVPRLPRDSGGTVVDEPSGRAKLKRRKQSRIPQRIVLPSNLGADANTFSYTDILDYDRRDYQYGFLVLSDVPANHLSDDHLGTTETELGLFRGSPLYEDYSNPDHSSLSEMFATSVDRQLSYSKKRASIEVGDRVRVVSGQYLGLIGYIIEYDGRDAQLKVTRSDDTLFFINVSGPGLLVDFQIGDLVEVFAGEYAGLTGWIFTLDQKTNRAQLAEHRLAPIGFQAAGGNQRSRRVGASLSELGPGQDVIREWDIALHCIRQKKIALDLHEPTVIGPPTSSGSIVMPRSRADPYVDLEITIVHGDLKGCWGRVKASRDRGKKLDIITEGRSINTRLTLSEDHVRDLPGCQSAV